MVKRPPPREQAPIGGVRCLPDRQGERAVECCHEPKGAYGDHLVGAPGNRRAAGPGSLLSGSGTPTVPVGTLKPEVPGIDAGRAERGVAGQAPSRVGPGPVRLDNGLVPTR